MRPLVVVGWCSATGDEKKSVVAVASISCVLSDSLCGNAERLKADLPSPSNGGAALRGVCAKQGDDTQTVRASRGRKESMVEGRREEAPREGRGRPA